MWRELRDGLYTFAQGDAHYTHLLRVMLISISLAMFHNHCVMDQRIFVVKCLFPKILELLTFEIVPIMTCNYWNYLLL